MIINKGFQSLNSSLYNGKAWKNLMLVSVSEMLASPPTIKPANNKQHGDESKLHHRSISFRILKEEEEENVYLSKGKRWPRVDNRICGGEGHDQGRKRGRAS